MRLKSTGLGKMELDGEIVKIQKVGDLLIFFVNTSKPVKWKTRMAFQEKDLRDLVWALLRPKNLSFVLKALFGQKNSPATDDF